MMDNGYGKFAFRIRTRGGSVVENLVIFGRNEADAVRKLRQMYRDCEILHSGTLRNEPKIASLSFEDIADLITGSDAISPTSG